MTTRKNETSGAWIKAVVLLLLLNTAGIGYIGYQISLPTLEDSIRDEAAAAAAEADVRVELWALSVAEEVHRRIHGAYTTSLDALQVRPAEGVVIRVLDATENHWSATGTHIESGIVCTADDITPVLGDDYRAYCESGAGS